MLCSRGSYSRVCYSTLRWAALLHDIAKPEMFSVDADVEDIFTVIQKKVQS